MWKIAYSGSGRNLRLDMRSRQHRERSVLVGASVPEFRKLFGTSRSRKCLLHCLSTWVEFHHFCHVKSMWDRLGIVEVESRFPLGHVRVVSRLVTETALIFIEGVRSSVQKLTSQVAPTKKTRQSGVNNLAKPERMTCGMKTDFAGSTIIPVTVG